LLMTHGLPDHHKQADFHHILSDLALCYLIRMDRNPKKS